MSGGRDVLNGPKGQGSESATVDEGCSRVMEDRVKQMEGKIESTEPDVFITREMPNQRSKNRVTYDYRSPTGTFWDPTNYYLGSG
jgi:hypothetical protein